MKYRWIFVIYACGVVTGILFSEILAHQIEQRSNSVLSEFFLMEGYEYFHDSKFSEAMMSAAKASATNPDWYAPHLLLSDIYAELNLTDNALEELGRAKELMSRFDGEPDIAEHDRKIIEKKETLLATEKND